MSNEWQAYGDDRNTPLKKGDRLGTRGGYVHTFSHVTDDGRIVTFDKGQHGNWSADDFSNVIVVGTIDCAPSWKATAEILIAALENGTPTGKQLAREEIRRMAAMLDTALTRE